MSTIEGTSGTTSYILILALQRSQKEKREKGAYNLSEDIIAKNFSNLGKETDIQVQEAQRVSTGSTQRESYKDTCYI